MDQRERYEEYLQDELDEQFSIYSVSHLLSKLSDYSRIILKMEYLAHCSFVDNLTLNLASMEVFLEMDY